MPRRFQPHGLIRAAPSLAFKEPESAPVELGLQFYFLPAVPGRSAEVN